jgi:hypothetical protein
MHNAKMIFTIVRIFVLLKIIAAFRRGCQRKAGRVRAPSKILFFPCAAKRVRVAEQEDTTGPPLLPRRGESHGPFSCSVARPRRISYVLKQKALTKLEQPDTASLTTHPRRYSFEPGLADPEW